MKEYHGTFPSDCWMAGSSLKDLSSKIRLRLVLVCEELDGSVDHTCLVDSESKFFR